MSKCEGATFESKLAGALNLRMIGRTTREVAKEIGVSHSTISRVLNQKTPDLHSFIKIVNWLGIEPRYFFGMRDRDKLYFEAAKYDILSRLMGESKESAGNVEM